MKKISPGLRGTFSESVCWSDGKFDFYIVRMLSGISFTCSDSDWNQLKGELEDRGEASLSDVGIELPEECECLEEEIHCVDLSSGDDVPPSELFMMAYHDERLTEEGFSFNITSLWLNGDTWTAENS